MGRLEKSKKKKINEYLELFFEFFKIGIFTIGGGMAMIPQLQQVAVRDKGWLSEEDMLDCIAVSQTLPGVIAVNSATYIGMRLKGLRGSLVATLGVVMPSFIIIILAITLIDNLGDNSYVQGGFTGIKAAVCGLILVTVIKLAKQTLKNWFQWLLAIVALVAIGALKINVIWVILLGAILGIVYNSIKIKYALKDNSERGGAKK